MMETINLEGETLGQKHRHYNKLITEFITTNSSQEIKKIDYNEPDIDNIFKIDIASKQRNVDYILEVLKCDDMLYVSRTLKQSVWLITDARYADIINPDYLHTKLLPSMTSKAAHKLILTIRLNLKDENRVELFCKYYEERNELETAMKWLQHCSVSFIENMVEKHFSKISVKLLKKLCEKSITILELYALKESGWYTSDLLLKTTFLLKTDPEKFVSIVNSQQYYKVPRLSPKATKIIMRNKPDLILDNFEKFGPRIHIPTFVKFLKSEDIKEFLLNHLKNNKLKGWFFKTSIKHFIFRMPIESRFDFVKSVCIENPPEINPCYDNGPCDMVMRCSSLPDRLTSNANIYKWYKFAPFSIAFTDLKKLIRVESNPKERNEIFAVLIRSAKRNSENLHLIIQYYHDKHMNEPLKFKSHFVNIVLSHSHFHKFDDKTWTILNDIFCSMEVYSENGYNNQSCLKYIIVYKVVHDTKVPDIIEKKIEFDTMKSFQSKLNEEESDKVFNYLYQFIITKIQNITISIESDLQAVITHIIEVLNLLSDWKKNLLNYSVILNKIREIITIKQDKCWSTDLSGIYNVNKSWRKHMYNESLSLNLTLETCLNTLKHGPKILMLSTENISSNDSLVSRQLLTKLRTYWPLTLAKAFEDSFRNQLNDKTKHKISVRGLCCLLPKKQLAEILSKYKPQDTKINWAESNDSTVSIQKCFAKYMCLARPHVSGDIVLLYANGDYLQFALPSLHSILFNISSDQSIKFISKLLDAPVSVQKHGLRLAFAKLRLDELLPICLNTWKSTKNSTIRATLFKIVFGLLYKEHNENRMKDIWHILEQFIDNLTLDENRTIYYTLSNAKEVPLPVREAYSIKSYRYFKSLPSKSNRDEFFENVIRGTLDIMESIDVDFMLEVVFDFFEKKITKNYHGYEKIISAFLLSTKSEAIQTQRYEKLFVPLLKKHLSLLKDTKNNEFVLKHDFNNILESIQGNFKDITVKKNMITPIKLFNDILNDLENNLSVEDNYMIITNWKIATIYIQCIENCRWDMPDQGQSGTDSDDSPDQDQSGTDSDDSLDQDRSGTDSDDSPDQDQSGTDSDDSPDQDRSGPDSDDSDLWIKLCLKAAPDFAKLYMEQLKKEIKTYYPSTGDIFMNALLHIFNTFTYECNVKLATLKAIQEHADIIEGDLLVLKVISNLARYIDNSDDNKIKDNILKTLASHSSPEVRVYYHYMVLNEELYIE